MEALDGALESALVPADEQSAAAILPGGSLATLGVGVRFGETRVLSGISLSFQPRSVHAVIGPSGCGKTTLLRTLNRLVELNPAARVEGTVVLAGADLLLQPAHDVRRRIGMVFQRPNPFPSSIFDNVAYALRDQGSKRPRRRFLAEPVEVALRRAGLWDEIKDDLGRSALRLSGGQQQRLCIARVLAATPDVMLMDEPCSSLDPASTASVEELIASLKQELTVVVVTHNLAQAARVSDRVAFLLGGELVEEGDTEAVFRRPSRGETADYVAGRFG
jgi:phosphate transport system ATP-binding protein